jgi:hypothetical protein
MNPNTSAHLSHDPGLPRRRGRSPPGLRMSAFSPSKRQDQSPQAVSAAVRCTPHSHLQHPQLRQTDRPVVASAADLNLRPTDAG